MKNCMKVKFISTQSEQHYKLKVISEDSTGITEQHEKTFDVTELFDTYGYMHRLQVQVKVIKFIQSIKQV